MNPRPFDVARWVYLGTHPVEIDYSPEGAADWDRLCAQLNGCDDAEQLAAILEHVAERIAERAGGVCPRPECAAQDLGAAWLRGAAWAALGLLEVLTAERLEAADVVARTLALAASLDGPTTEKRWRLDLATAAAASRHGAAKGGRNKSREGFGPELQAWLEEEYGRQRSESEVFKLTVARGVVARRFERKYNKSITPRTIAKHTHDPRKARS